MTKDKKAVGKLPSKRINELEMERLDRMKMTRTSIMYAQVSALIRTHAIADYLDEQANLKQSEEK